MTNKILKAYIEYLEYPTLVVDFKNFGFHSIDGFIEEGARLKSEYLGAQWFEDMPFFSLRDDMVDALRFQNEYLGTGEAHIIFDKPLDTHIVADEIPPHTVTQFPIYNPSPLCFLPIEPPDTPSYRKDLNEIRRKEIANKFTIRYDLFFNKKIENTTFWFRKRFYEIRAPTLQIIACS